MLTGFGFGEPRERDNLEGSGLDGRIILKWICREWDVGAWAGLFLPRLGTVGGHL